MRVSGQKLRIAVGTGIAALMLTLGVSSVGATAPVSVGSEPVVIVSNTSSPVNTNPTRTNTTYRDAVRITNRAVEGNSDIGGLDECLFVETGRVSNAATVSSVDKTGFVCGTTNPIIQPAAYPLWEVQTGSPGTNVLVVPPTGVPGNRTVPTRGYAIETFR